MSPETSESIISADRPIEKPEEDILNRNNFSITIAKMIAEWKGKESLVISLNGPWGCGKTSIKNLIVHELEKNDAAYCLEFNPWMWSGKKELTDIFFSEIASQVLGNKDKSEKFIKIAKQFKILRAVVPSFEINKNVISVISTVLAGISGVLVARGIKLDTAYSIWIAIFIGIALLGITNIVIWYGLKFCEAFAEYHSKSLVEKRRDITKDLKRLPKPIAIVIDDIDRLENEEITTIFQIVKANANFYNMIYFLLFDKNRIKKVLKNFHDNDDEYLNKIIQISFTVPALDFQELENVFYEKLNNAIAIPRYLIDFNDQRWQEISRPGILGFFKSIRDVNRFFNSFNVTINIFIRNGHLDVDLIDYLAIEAIRIFGNEIYLSLPNAKDFLTGERQSLHFFDSKDEIKTRCKTWWAQFENHSNAATYLEIISAIFPDFEYMISDNIPHKYLSYDEAYRNNMACHPDHFDKYFQFAVPKHMISQSEVDFITKNLDNQDALKKCFEKYSSGQQQESLIKTIRAYHKIRMPENPSSFISTLMDIADYLPRGDVLQFSPSLTLCTIAHTHLRDCVSKESRFKTLIDAFRQSTGLYVMCYFIDKERHDDTRKTNDEKLFSSDDFSEIKDIFIKKCKTMFLSSFEDILKREGFPAICYTASFICDDDFILSAVTANISSYFFDICNKFSTSHISSDGTQKRLSFKNISKFCDIEKFKLAFESIDKHSLNHEQIELYDAVSDMFQRKADGIPDDYY